MHIKPNFFNSPEEATLRELALAVRSSPYWVYAKVRMLDVLETDLTDDLEPWDEDFLRKAHFDFVVVSRFGRRTLHFAVEFDGPAHDLDQMQAKRDITKNRLCAMANFPLLRISDVELEEYEKETILRYMVERFIAWEKEKDSIQQEIRDYVAGLSPEQLGRVKEDAPMLDPTLDPGFIFDIRHPFPGIKIVAERLCRQFGIASDYLTLSETSAIRSEPCALACSLLCVAMRWEGHDVVRECGYAVFKPQSCTKNPQQIWPLEESSDVLLKGTIAIRLRMSLPVVNDYDGVEAPVQYYLRTGKMPSMVQDIPGAFPCSIAGELVVYLGFREIENWANQHFRKASS